MSHSSAEPAALEAVIFRRAGVEEILPLRNSVLIAGTNRSPVFPDDELDSTVHLGAFHGDACVACLRLSLSIHEGRPAWNLRSMASAPEWRGRGAGMGLILFAEREICAPSDLDMIWLNSRETALDFYLRAGYSLDSDRFVIDNVGPHYRMIKPKAMFGRRAQS